MQHISRPRLSRYSMLRNARSAQTTRAQLYNHDCSRGAEWGLQACSPGRAHAHSNVVSTASSVYRSPSWSQSSWWCS